MRHILFHGGLAEFALNIRDRVAIVNSALRLPEEVGTIANDQIARYLLDRLCLPGRTFVDVGAHIGSVVYGVCRHSEPGRVVAIEAIPEKAVALRRRFPRVEVIGSAVGARTGRATFTIDLDASGYSSLDAVPDGHRARQIEVPIDRLDTLVSDHRHVDVVKIDVEGSEFDVLRGADAMVRTARPTILFESAPSSVLRDVKPAIWHWLTERDYEVILPSRLAHDGAGMSGEAFVEAHLYPRRTTNYFAAPRERRVELRERARAILKVPRATRPAA